METPHPPQRPRLPAEAEPLLLEDTRVSRNARPVFQEWTNFYLETAGSRLVKLYHDWGKSEKVAEWSAKLQETKLANSLQ